MNNDNLKLYNERLNRLTNAVELKKPDRVPITSIIDNWALFNNGTTLKEARADIETEYAAYSKANTEAYFDTISFPGITMPLNFMTSLGGGIYQGDTDTIQIATGQSEIMKIEEYDELIKNPKSYLLNVILPRKIEILQAGTVQEKFEKLSKGISLLMKFFHERSILVERFKEERGLPVLEAVGPFIAGDLMLDALRDFSGTINDIKRRPELFAEACMLITTKFNIPATYAALPHAAPDKYLHLFLHLPPFLKPKEFGKAYWPSFKLYIETFAKQGYKFVIFFEKNWEHLYSYLQELPAGCILGLFEEDDLKKTKLALSKNMCIGGGISTNDLAYKTPQQCIDIAKRTIDGIAPGGGFVFCTDKVLNSKNDAKRDCLIAVNAFVHDYAAY